MISRRTVVVFCIAAVAVPRLAYGQTKCRAAGRFSGPIVAELLPDGRKLKLVQPVTYIARCGKRWEVPKDAITDGASIPAFLWRAVGSPLVGAYRNAAVIHDYYCSIRTENDILVHQMFYEAMLCSGVSAYKAAQLYLGVRIGGPSWDELTRANSQLALQAAARNAAQEAARREMKWQPASPSRHGSNFKPPSRPHAPLLPRPDFGALKTVEYTKAAGAELSRVVEKLPTKYFIMSLEVLDRNIDTTRAKIEEVTSEAVDLRADAMRRF